MTPELQALVEAVKPPPLLLTNQAAAAYLGLSEDGWARAKAAAGPDFPRPRRVPGRSDPMYHRRDVEAFADKLEKAGTALPARRKAPNPGGE